MEEEFGQYRLSRRLQCMVATLQLLLKDTPMKPEVEALATKVAELKTVEDSAVALLDGLKARLDDALATSDWAKVQALAEDIGGESTELSAAVARNTVAADPPPVVVEPAPVPGEQGAQGAPSEEQPT